MHDHFNFTIANKYQNSYMLSICHKLYNPQLLNQNTFNDNELHTDYLHLDFSKSFLENLSELVTNKYTEKLISHLNLTEPETYFLARVSDMAHRGYTGQSQEPVVRCVELDVQAKFMDIPDDIMSSCNLMNEFWENHIFPNLDVTGES